jgi:hypothetical protein
LPDFPNPLFGIETPFGKRITKSVTYGATEMMKGVTAMVSREAPLPNSSGDIGIGGSAISIVCLYDLVNIVLSGMDVSVSHRICNAHFPFFC